MTTNFPSWSDSFANSRLYVSISFSSAILRWMRSSSSATNILTLINTESMA